jgi:hypothetical protein
MVSLKKSAFILCFLFSYLSTNFFAHNSYFAFAEIEYKEKESKIEATLVLTAHDFEEFLKNSNRIRSTLENALSDSVESEIILTEINQHFAISSGIIEFAKNQIKLKYDGYQLLLNGNIEFYFSAWNVLPQSAFTIRFDLLMDFFPEQQNKVTLIYRTKKRTCVFLRNTPIQSIELN